MLIWIITGALFYTYTLSEEYDTYMEAVRRIASEYEKEETGVHILFATIYTFGGPLMIVYHIIRNLMRRSESDNEGNE